MALKQQEEKAKPSVLLIDIETSPILGWTWEMYDTRVLRAVESSKIISVAWKELDDKEVHVKSIFDYKGYKKGVVDDEALVREVWDVLDKADIIIAHHGDAFDLKKLNARFIFHGLAAPSSFKSIDTRKSASKYFKFDSNSLDNLGTYLQVGNKMNNGGFDLWINCITHGDPAAWKLMKDYNSQDVLLLEKVYYRLRPYIANHPSLSVMVDKTTDEGEACPTCLSTSLIKRGFSSTRTGRKQRYQCKSCFSWSSGPFVRVKSVLSNDDD